MLWIKFYEHNISETTQQVKFKDRKNLQLK